MYPGVIRSIGPKTLASRTEKASNSKSDR